MLNVGRTSPRSLPRDGLRSLARATGAFAVIALLAGACGGGGVRSLGEAPAAQPPRVSSPEPAAAPSVAAAGPSALPAAGPIAPATGPNEIPAVVVRDIANGRDVNLSSLVPSGQATLFWFWAPH